MKTRYQFAWVMLGLVIAFAGLALFGYSKFPRITDYPFTIAWSESGRIFNAYQIYGSLLTGQHLPWPWLDPGRSILDGLALLISPRQIGFYRFWVDFLFLVFAFVTSLAVVRKTLAYAPLLAEGLKKGLFWLLVLWGTLFLLQGPVYYHVLLGVVAILWLYDSKKPVLVLLLVVFGSAWEGLGRVNWFMMPAFVAVLLHALTEPYSGNGSWKYVRWPLVYLVSGGLASFLSYFIFIRINGYVIPFLDPQMHYAYFLYKLWPNAGFIGLIPGMLLMSSLLLAVVLYVVWKHRSHIHWLRMLILGGILALFFAGSTLVSIRAGGGYDYHNYDSFFLLLFICGCFFGLDATQLDRGGPLKRASLTNIIIPIGLTIISILFSYHPAQPVSSVDINQSQAAIQKISSVIETLGKGDRPVLFIDERQLLIYQMIPQVPMYVAYDKIELMEMAMARNGEYAKKFSSDIENHKFSLVISEVLQKWPKHFDPANIEQDWYENNEWVSEVSTPILTYYHPVYVNQDLGFAMYAPN